jgi:UDP-N-acetylmuramoyl-L-alanyl-D-glutamate--2,6-diaminopimelate ligase
MAAFAVATTGIRLEPGLVLGAIKTFPGVPGRMEKIQMGQSFTAIVDFAHTPYALQSALESARSLTKGRVIAVFGSAGLRDRLKRRMMAEISAQKADISIITAEDPRTEALDSILDEMMTAAVGVGGVEGQTIFRVADRGQAIRLGVKLARAGDVLLACGKGHEQSMCFGEIEYSWDDRTALRAALAEYLDIDGPAMPVLPTSQVL